MVAFPLSKSNPVSARLQSQRLLAHPKKVIMIGDSLVYGFGDPVGGGWVERLRRQWMDPEVPGPILYNLGVRGDTVQQVNQRLESEFLLRGELRRRTPDVLVLSVGLNDVARLGRSTGRFMTDEATFQSQIEALLDQAQLLPCPVFFKGMVPVNESAMPYADTLYFSSADQLRYKDITRLACEARQIPYLDIYEKWVSQGQDWCHARLCQDGIHPNILGYETLLEDVKQWQPLMDEISVYG